MNDLLGLLLALALAWAVWHSVRKAKQGGGCCGGREALPPKVRVRDRNKAHYPYEITLHIGGMSCENCARKVENALNSAEGVWARVDLSRRTALVRCKGEINAQALSGIVRASGYVVLP